jgi:hypothetical protein
MIKIRKSEERGHADHGWLKTYHTFSFNTYHDKNFMGFRTLRVINDDIIAPSKGFGTHPHNDMEIITYVLEGALEHKDSMGSGSVIKPGDVQRMSAGRGIFHSEFNPSRDKAVHLLQIWIMPDQKSVTPSYEQKNFPRGDKLNRFKLIASNKGKDGSVTIYQDANVYSSIIGSGTTTTFKVDKERHIWLHVAKGRIMLGDLELSSGDGAAISEETELNFTGIEESELLLFDLA